MVNFLESRLIFNIFYCFWMFTNKNFKYLTCTYLKDIKWKKCYKVEISAYYFQVKTKISWFQICISVPLKICELVLLFNSNEPIKVAYLQKWVNQLILKYATWYQQLPLWIQGKHCSLDKWSNFLTKKDIWTMNNVFSKSKVYIESRFLQVV